ncbi:Uncharacterized protein Rs2_21277 [Raphanus sativus]|nr:Uncharacterized protein Rs2_21277 [Raphanus sativus]
MIDRLCKTSRTDRFVSFRNLSVAVAPTVVFWDVDDFPIPTGRPYIKTVIMEWCQSTLTVRRNRTIWMMESPSYSKGKNIGDFIGCCWTSLYGHWTDLCPLSPEKI